MDRQSRVDHFNEGAAGSDRETSYEAEKRAQVRSLYGSKDIDRLFPGQAPKTLTPWPDPGRRRGEPKWDEAAVHTELEREPRLVRIDPRILSAGQPHILRGGVEHYLGGKYEETGETFEAGHNVGNQFPFVVTQRGGTQHVIISGHHRAAAALLRGEHLRTRWIEQT